MCAVAPVSVILTCDLYLQRARGIALLRPGVLAHRHHLDAAGVHTARGNRPSEDHSGLMLGTTSTKPLLLECAVGRGVCGAGSVNMACPGLAVQF